MKKLTCIICPKGCEMLVEKNGEEYTITGNLCNRGRDYAIYEMTDPHRSITSTVKTSYPEVPRLPVRTDREVPVNSIFPVMRQLDHIRLDHPVHTGEVICENVAGTGVNLIAAADLYELLEVL